MKMLMKIALPKMGVVGDDDDDDFPLPEGCFPGRTTPPEP